MAALVAPVGAASDSVIVTVVAAVEEVVVTALVAPEGAASDPVTVSVGSAVGKALVILLVFSVAAALDSVTVTVGAAVGKALVTVLVVSGAVLTLAVAVSMGLVVGSSSGTTASVVSFCDEAIVLARAAAVVVGGGRVSVAVRGASIASVDSEPWGAEALDSAAVIVDTAIGNALVTCSFVADALAAPPSVVVMGPSMGMAFGASASVVGLSEDAIVVVTAVEAAICSGTVSALVVCPPAISADAGVLLAAASASATVTAGAAFGKVL